MMDALKGYVQLATGLTEVTAAKARDAASACTRPTTRTVRLVRNGYSLRHGATPTLTASLGSWFKEHARFSLQ